jgi:hypothetical protein
MKIRIITNVIKGQDGRLQFPYGIAQFRSFLSRHFITADQPYRHGSKLAVKGDIMIWAFKDETDKWYLIGDGFVRNKLKADDGNFLYYIESARLYPRNVPLADLSFFKKANDCLFYGYTAEWSEYQEILEKAIEPLAT